MTQQTIILLLGIAAIFYSRDIAAFIGPRLLPLLGGAVTRAKAIDPGWLSFGKGAVLAFVLMLFVGKVEIPWPVFPPPTPGPVDPVVVVPGDGPMVLMVEETDDRKTYTPDQLTTLNSTAPGSVRDYCANHCAKIDGLPAVRVIDKDQLASLDMEQPWVKAAAAQVDTSKLPFVVMSNGKVGAKFQIENPSMTTAALQRLEGGK